MKNNLRTKLLYLAYLILLPISFTWAQTNTKINNGSVNIKPIIADIQKLDTAKIYDVYNLYQLSKYAVWDNFNSLSNEQQALIIGNIKSLGNKNITDTLISLLMGSSKNAFKLHELIFTKDKIDENKLKIFNIDNKNIDVSSIIKKRNIVTESLNTEYSIVSKLRSIADPLMKELKNSNANIDSIKLLKLIDTIKKVDFLIDEYLKLTGKICLQINKMKDTIYEYNLFISNNEINPIFSEILYSFHKVYKDSMKVVNKDSTAIVNKDSTIVVAYNDKIDEFFKILVDTSINRINNYNNEIKRLNDSLFNAYKLSITGSKEIANVTLTPQQQIQVQEAIAAQVQNRGGNNGFSLPSESEIIEAMAIFLANRTKQEAIIWFMDQVKSELHNPLIADAFPEVIKLLQNINEYKAPSFGPEWRYAISKDFMSLPKNVINSPWVSYTLDDNKDKVDILKTSINFAYDLNMLMNSNYNYRDIISHFYINQDTSINEKNNKIQYGINNSITLLYILTNEFFNIDNFGTDKAKYRLISYEELTSMSPERWNTLLDLIVAKYNHRLPKTFVTNLKSQLNREWLAKILISLSQFDKINTQIQNADFKNNEFNPQTFWTIIQQTIENINDNPFIKGNGLIKKQSSKYLNTISDCISIYESLKLKDYNALIQKTIALVDEYMMQPNGNDSTFSQVVMATKKSAILNASYEQNCLTISVNGANTFGIKIEDNCIITTKDTIYINLSAFKKHSNILSYKLDKASLENILKDINLINNAKKLNKVLYTTDAELLQLLNLAYQYHISKENATVNNYLKYLTMFNNASLEKLILSNNAYGNKYYKKFQTLVSFMGDVIAAQNKEELSSVISNHVLPPTSYKLKKKTKYSWDINAYVGFGGGYYENFSNDIGATTLEDKQYTYGISAPIGLTYSTSLKKDYLINHFGISINPLDLGFLVNHYLMQPKNEFKRDVHFSEIFSPNVNLLFGFRNSPMVLFAGYKLLPLRSKEGNINSDLFDGHQVQLGIKFDIPLYNIKHKEKIQFATKLKAKRAINKL